MNESVAAARRAIALASNYAAAHFHLGAALCRAGDFDTAANSYRRALDINPDDPEAMNDLAVCQIAMGELESAIALCKNAIAHVPEFAEAHTNLGNALKAQGRLNEAIASYRAAISHDSRFAKAFNNLGVALMDRGKIEESHAAFAAALAIDPNYAECLTNLGNLLLECGQPDDAVRVLSRAIELQPELAEARNNLGNALRSRGELSEAIAAYERAAGLRPAVSHYRSNAMFTRLFCEGIYQADIRRQLEKFNELFDESESTERFLNVSLSARPLRIGYISPDFRDHVVGRNVLPLLRHHDRRQFQTFAYARLHRKDGLTSFFRAAVDQWRDITTLRDESAAALIRRDRIDILVDLSMHLSDNALPILARRAAPIQMTFAAYPGSTGLAAVDYRLTDPYLDSPATVLDYLEKSLFLESSFWCYDPRVRTEEVPRLPAVAPLPAEDNGFITFGNLGDFCKVSDGTLRRWARVLGAVKGSRLLMLAPAGQARERVLGEFRQLGISLDRLIFVARQPRLDYLRTYGLIDIALDTLPYNGHTTSLDAMWMGVPVVSEMGHTVVGRAGWSQMSNLGLTELVADSSDRFVNIATDLAADFHRLLELRSTLRGRMEASTIMNAPAFTHSVENAYRAAWREWCGAQAAAQVLPRVEVYVPAAATRGAPARRDSTLRKSAA